MWFWITPVLAHVAVIYPAGPDDDICAMINEEVGTGDILLLDPGTYVVSCDIVRNDYDLEDIAYTTIRSADVDDPAVIVPAEGSPYALQLEGQYLFLSTLTFAGVGEDQVGVRIVSGKDIFVRYSTFRDSAGDAIAADVGAVENLGIFDVQFLDIGGTALSVGCDKGDASCRLDSPVLQDNLFARVGVGIRVGPDTTAQVRDTIVLDAGLALEGGAVDPTRGVEIARTFFEGPVQLDGAARVESSIFVDALWWEGSGALIGSTLVAGVALSGPTASGNATQGGDLGAGNVTCEDPEKCWVDALAWDFYPRNDGLLVDVGSDAGVDFCGAPRDALPDAGALEYRVAESYGSISEAFKFLGYCPLDLPESDLLLPAAEPTGSETSLCGCRASGIGGGTTTVSLLLFMFLVARRQRLVPDACVDAGCPW